MAVRSTQLWGPVAVPVAPAVVKFTCPPDRTAIIRSLFLTYSGVLQAADVRLALTPEGGGAAVEFWRGAVPSTSTTQVGYVILDPGAEISAALGSAPPSGTVRVSAFGSLLFGPPV